MIYILPNALDCTAIAYIWLKSKQQQISWVFSFLFKSKLESEEDVNKKRLWSCLSVISWTAIQAWKKTTSQAVCVLIGFQT